MSAKMLRKPPTQNHSLLLKKSSPPLPRNTKWTEMVGDYTAALQYSSKSSDLPVKRETSTNQHKSRSASKWTNERTN